LPLALADMVRQPSRNARRLLGRKGSRRDRQCDDDDQEAEDIDYIQTDISQSHWISSPVEAFCNSLLCRGEEVITKGHRTNRRWTSFFAQPTNKFCTKNRETEASS
jgi:hypothetical protein